VPNEADRAALRLGIREWAGIITMLLNFGGLIWGAAIMYASVSDLRKAVTDLNATSSQIVHDLTSVKVEYHARISVLEAEIRRLRRDSN
jgi:uncharacterized small protein (DUF1192 family)